MYWPNLKSVAFPVPEIIGSTRKIWAVPEYAHASFSPCWKQDQKYKTKTKTEAGLVIRPQ